MKYDNIKESLLLYGITDRTWLGDHSLIQDVEAALRGGVTFLQLREKNCSKPQRIALAKELQSLCRQYRVPFIINDDLEVALAVDADGVHIGAKDGDILQVRQRLGKDKILGVSTRNLDQALAAEEHGADYLGVGSVFHTSTKEDAQRISRETLQKICASVSIPVVAIGGISPENALELKGSGICGLCVISALFAAKDIQEAALALRNAAEKVTGGKL